MQNFTEKDEHSAARLRTLRTWNKIYQCEKSLGKTDKKKHFIYPLDSSVFSHFQFFRPWPTLENGELLDSIPFFHVKLSSDSSKEAAESSSFLNTYCRQVEIREHQFHVAFASAHSMGWMDPFDTHVDILFAGKNYLLQPNRQRKIYESKYQCMS